MFPICSLWLRSFSNVDGEGSNILKQACTWTSNALQAALLKERLEMEKYYTPEGRKKYTIKPFEDKLSFDKVGWFSGLGLSGLKCCNRAFLCLFVLFNCWPVTMRGPSWSVWADPLALVHFFAFSDGTSHSVVIQERQPSQRKSDPSCQVNGSTDQQEL